MSKTLRVDMRPAKAGQLYRDTIQLMNLELSGFVHGEVASEDLFLTIQQMLDELLELDRTLHNRAMYYYLGAKLQ